MTNPAISKSKALKRIGRVTKASDAREIASAVLDAMGPQDGAKP